MMIRWMEDWGEEMMWLWLLLLMLMLELVMLIVVVELLIVVQTEVAGVWRHQARCL